MILQNTGNPDWHVPLKLSSLYSSSALVQRFLITGVCQAKPRISASMGTMEAVYKAALLESPFHLSCSGLPIYTQAGPPKEKRFSSHSLLSLESLSYISNFGYI